MGDPTKESFESASRDMTPRQAKAFKKGRARLVWDRESNKWKITLNRKLLEARGPMTTVGVVLLFLVVGGLLMTSLNAYGLGDIRKDSYSTTDQFLTGYQWETGIQHAELQLYTDDSEPLNWTINVTIVSEIKTVSQTNMGYHNVTNVTLPISRLSEFIFEARNITVVIGITNGTDASLITIDLIQENDVEVWRVIQPIIIVVLAWFSGAWIWTGAKGRDPAKVAIDKTTPT